MSRVVGAAFYALLARYISLLIQLVSVMAISRLLTPKEIGIYSISASIFGLALLIRDFGIGSYLVQAKTVDQTLASSAFSVSLLLCWPLSLVAFYSGPYVASFYEIEETSQVFKFLAINLLVIPFGSITLSLLKREMHFNKVMFIDIGSSFVGAFVTVICAFNGSGFMSLAYGSVAGTITTVLIATLYRPKWLPFMPGTGRIKEIAAFGWRISGANFFSQINSSSPDMILGKVQGPVEAVFFNKTVSVFKLFNQMFQNSMRPVLQSYVAEVDRENKGVNTAVLKMNGFYLMLAWPFIVILFFHADAIVNILFGDQWGRVVPLVKIMCVSHAINSIFVFHQSTLTGLGKASSVLRMTGVLCIAQVSIVFMLSTFDLEYIFIGLISVSFIRAFLVWRDMVAFMGISLKNVLENLWLPLLYSLVLIVINSTGSYLFKSFGNSIVEFFLMLLLSLLAMVVMIFSGKHELKYFLLKIINTKFKRA